MDYKKYDKIELQNIANEQAFIVFCSKETKKRLPAFSYIYKKVGDKVFKYSFKAKTKIAELSLKDYFNEAEDLLYVNIYYIVCEGDPLEFIRFMNSTELSNYFSEIANYEFNNIVLPETFDTETVNKYLEDYSKKVFEFTTNESIAKRSAKEKRTFWIAIISIALTIANTIYNIFFK